MIAALPFDTDIRNSLHLLSEHGEDITALLSRYEQLDSLIPKDQRRTDPAWQQLEQDTLAALAPIPSREPSQYADILAARPHAHVDSIQDLPTDEILTDKIAGGWQGRIAGCILGKPVECLMREKDSRAKLTELLQQSGEYPLNDFISEQTILPYWEEIGTKLSWFTGKNPTLRGYIDHAASDDDLNYTVLALNLLKSKGKDFTSDDMLDCWHASLPYTAVCTAEKMAYRNRAMGMSYPETATFANSYYEWVGGQIRADAYGYVNPGNMLEAARMAWHDAAATSLMSGLYGAMWVAAAIAAAFVEDDPETIIRRGLEQVPADCRFTEHLEKTIAAAKRNGTDYTATFDDIQARVGHYHCVHTVNNACIVAAALLHGGHDLGQVISIAVMGGLDTDCNGATAGSIAGVMVGKSNIANRWIAPFNDTLHTSISGHNVVRISGLIADTVERMHKFAK